MGLNPLNQVKAFGHGGICIDHDVTVQTGLNPLKQVKAFGHQGRFGYQPQWG